MEQPGLAGDARVVHRKMEPAELLCRSPDRRADLFIAGDVTLNRERPAGVFRIQCRDGSIQLLLASGHYADIRAAVRQCFGDGLADAFGPPG
jgi:hypothetical protein